MLHRNTHASGSGRNECDLDMEDTEETKEEPIAQISVPVENFRLASKSLTVEKIDIEE